MMETIKTRENDFVDRKMNFGEIKMKKCVVMLEPCTPKAQLALSAELRQVINERNVLTARTKKKLVSALDELNSADVSSKRESCRKKAIQELLDTEMTYLKQLEVIKNYFMLPIESRKLLTPEEFETVFGCLDILYKVNGELLNELKEDPVNVALAFSKLAPYFKQYSVYAYDYKKCLDMLQKLHHNNQKFSVFVGNQESRPEVQAKLSSLLITPIQRIPRYCMLLKQVLDCSVQTDDDYEVLKKSVEELQSVARHVDSLVDDRDNSQKILELLRRIRNCKNIVKPGRKLVKEGCLKRFVEGRSNEKVYIVLMTDILIHCTIKKNDVSEPNSLKCRTIYPLSKCTLLKNSHTKMFEIRCADESLVMYHWRMAECDEWANVFTGTIERCIKNRTTLRKESSSRRPVREGHFALYSDVGVSPGVSRVRKRRWTEDGDDDDKDELSEKINCSDSLGQKENSSNCLPLKLSGRSNIHSCIPSEALTGRDSLYPLRRHVIDKTSENDENSSESKNNIRDVYVFGKNNELNHGFNFKLGSFLSGIGNSVKKVFGFK